MSSMYKKNHIFEIPKVLKCSVGTIHAIQDVNIEGTRVSPFDSICLGVKVPLLDHPCTTTCNNLEEKNMFRKGFFILCKAHLISSP